MKEGFYKFRVPNEAVYVTGGQRGDFDAWAYISSGDTPYIARSFHLTPLPYFRDISSPTTEELNMLQMVDEKCYNEVVKIMKEMGK